MKQPVKTIIEPSSSQGEPCIISMMPQPMKNAKIPKTATAAINFIGEEYNHSKCERKP